ncbi:MAG: hypothetical protein U0871_23215 [Gemmataceae bacterium]
MTRTAILLGLLAAAGLTGCRSNDGAAPRGFDTPRTLRGSERPDRPDLPIEEQQRRGRARYGLFEDDSRVAPNGYADRPGPSGR